MELIRSLLLHRLRPSPDYSWVGSCIISFVACSAFTHVTTQTRQVALCDPLHRRLRRVRCLHRRSDCYRVERSSSRAGLSSRCGPALFTARCNRLVTAARQRDDRMITETANQGRRFRVPTSRKIRGESSGPRPHQVPAMPIVRRTPFRPTILSSLWSLILTR